MSIDTEDLLAGSSIDTEDLLAGSSIDTEDLLAGSSINTGFAGRIEHRSGTSSEIDSVQSVGRATMESA